jgi:hypothetical protein
MQQISHEKAQWTLDVTVYHGPDFGHWVRASVLGRHGGWRLVGTWSWKGLGIPEPLLPDIEARIASVITEHLVTRYGVRQTLPFEHQGDPGTT